MADNSILKLLKYYFSKLKSFFFSKDVLSFLLFLILSSGFWFINVLDKERVTEILIPLRFDGLPKNIAITNEQPAFVTIKVKDKGLQLFSYSKKNHLPISFNWN